MTTPSSGLTAASEDFTTRWQQTSQLQDYGWNVNIEENFNSEIQLDDLGMALNRLNLPTISGAPYVRVCCLHLTVSSAQYDDQQQEETRPYYPTGATYDNIFNVQDGVIIVSAAYGPKFEKEQMLPETFAGEIPPLQHWSDIVFLSWKTLQLTAEEMRKLKRIIVMEVANDDTKAALWHALSLSDPPVTAMPSWPGVTFPVDEDSEAGLALLGSANVLGVAYLLIQHRAELGDKTTRSITVWVSRCHDAAACVPLTSCVSG